VLCAADEISTAGSHLMGAIPAAAATLRPWEDALPTQRHSNSWAVSTASPA
jgi:hypothetical protein